MTKYYVGIQEVHVNTVVVEANSPEEAKEKARSEDTINLEYSHTLSSEFMTVECEADCGLE